MIDEKDHGRELYDTNHDDRVLILDALLEQANHKPRPAIRGCGRTPRDPPLAIHPEHTQTNKHTDKHTDKHTEKFQISTPKPNAHSSEIRRSGATLTPRSLNSMEYRVEKEK